jgi:hypothetical protein
LAHDNDPAEDEYFPAAQLEHVRYVPKSFLSSEKYPAWQESTQLSTEVEPYIELDFPTGQGVQVKLALDE